MIRILTHTVLSGGSQLSGLIPEDEPALPEIEGDRIQRVTLRDLRTGMLIEVEAKYFLDATELGDLTALCGAEYVIGSEAVSETGEAHGAADFRPANQQAITWVFAMGYDPASDHTIDRPNGYAFWKSFQPEFWPNPLFELQDLDPTNNLPRVPPLPLFAEDWRSWFKYRQIHNPEAYSPPQGFPTTIVNWPQNDFFLGEIVEVDPETRWDRLQSAKQQSLCLLYWLQTELGYKGLFAAPDPMGTPDGFAMTPYIRESRRIVARSTILEKSVSQQDNPGHRIAPPVPNSVGIGSYRIDLHPSTGGDAYIDLATLPFQIPLGSLIPQRLRNLLPACKNLGATHVTNGCYRLHPVEWNIGEAAGLLAAFCLRNGSEPHEVDEKPVLAEQFMAMLDDEGVERSWPEGRMF